MQGMDADMMACIWMRDMMTACPKTRMDADKLPADAMGGMDADMMAMLILHAAMQGKTVVKMICPPAVYATS